MKAFGSLLFVTPDEHGGEGRLTFHTASAELTDSHSYETLNRNSQNALPHAPSQLVCWLVSCSLSLKFVFSSESILHLPGVVTSGPLHPEQC